MQGSPLIPKQPSRVGWIMLTKLVFSNHAEFHGPRSDQSRSQYKPARYCRRHSMCIEPRSFPAHEVRTEHLLVSVCSLPATDAPRVSTVSAALTMCYGANQCNATLVTHPELYYHRKQNKQLKAPHNARIRSEVGKGTSTTGVRGDARWTVPQNSNS